MLSHRKSALLSSPSEIRWIDLQSSQLASLVGRRRRRARRSRRTWPTFGGGNFVGLGHGVELGQGVGLGEGDVIAVGSAVWLAYDIGLLAVFLVSTFLTGGLIPSPI